MIVWQKGDRVISIDEYIEYLEKCAGLAKGSDEGDRLSRQYTQLAVWLKELKSLRWLFKDIQDTCEHLYLENVRYRSCLTDDAENAKLRELVRELYEDAFSEHPSYFDKTYLSRLAELGVEVNRECTIAWLESEDA